ncbi:MAG: hypothetical protein JNL74_02185 [Fibrobacteres bacterium]|nr:hypothetical protein [Fibrobacterota bacterium]
MKVVVAVLMFLTCMIYAQSSVPSIGLTIPATDNSVKNILDYNLKSNLQSQIEGVHKQVSEKIVGEFHAGGGYIYGQNPLGVLAIKISPCNSKIAAVNTLRANVFRIRQTYASFNESITKGNDSLLSSIESELKKYEKTKWKRPSLGIVFPFNFLRYDTSYSFYYIGDSLAQKNRSISSRVDFTFKKIGAFVGYDLGDFCTVSVGVVDFNSPLFFAGLTADISTPTYWMVSSFKRNLRGLTQSYIPETGNPIY